MRRLRTALAGAIAAGATLVGAPAAVGESGAFDGGWDITLHCPAGPDGALPFTFALSGQVTGSMLHAEHGDAGQPGWLALDGAIGPTGDASLTARGITGQAAYNVGQTSRGIPYAHAVTAHFDGGSGMGSWVTNRTCDFASGGAREARTIAPV